METIVIAERKLSYKTVKRRKVDVDFEEPVDSPERAKTLFANLLKDEPNEALYCLAMDSSNRWLGVYKVAEGTVNRASVHPRRLLSFLLLDTNASATILCHNHPGGCTDFSREDIKLTEKLRDLLKDLDITIMDHLLCATSNLGSDLKWASMREEGLL
jgi:DNA repair protein RadC